MIDDIPEREKLRLTVDGLLEKFVELCKYEKLIDKMIER